MEKSDETNDRKQNKNNGCRITGKFKKWEESIISKTDQIGRIIKNESEKMKTESMTMSEKLIKKIMKMSKNTNTDITIKSKEVAKTDQMEQLIKNKTEDILTFF